MKSLPDYSIKLKNYRESINLTQRDVAEKLNVSLSIVRAYEQGQRKPKISTMLLMQKELGLNIFEVFFEEAIKNESCRQS